MRNPFRPIKATASDWTRDEDVETLDHTEQGRIENLLLGRTVEKVDADHLLLDNGVLIKAIGHDGGCACSAGCYDLSVLNGCDNIITRVEFDYSPVGEWGDARNSGHPDDPKDGWTGYYRVFVYADNQQINLMQFDGSDGNGYYGTGFELLVRFPEGDQ